jgi:hypothetical protein
MVPDLFGCTAEFQFGHLCISYFVEYPQKWRSTEVVDIKRSRMIVTVTIALHGEWWMECLIESNFYLALKSRFSQVCLPDV